MARNNTKRRRDGIWGMKQNNLKSKILTKLKEKVKTQKSTVSIRMSDYSELTEEERKIVDQSIQDINVNDLQMLHEFGRVEAEKGYQVSNLLVGVVALNAKRIQDLVSEVITLANGNNLEVLQEKLESIRNELKINNGKLERIEQSLKQQYNKLQYQIIALQEVARNLQEKGRKGNLATQKDLKSTRVKESIKEKIRDLTSARINIANTLEMLKLSVQYDEVTASSIENRIELLQRGQKTGRLTQEIFAEVIKDFKSDSTNGLEMTEK